MQALMCGVMWIGSGHCYPSHQLSIRGCKFGYLLESYSAAQLGALHASFHEL
jgi:hypothetical protein